MNSQFRDAVACGAALLLAGSAALAQSGSISGKVTIRGSSQPVVGANVQAISNVRTVGSATTGSDGSFTISNLPDGRYNVLARQIGLEFKLMEDVQVSGGGKATVDIVTSPLVAQLDRITSSADRGAQAEKVLESPNSISVVPEVQIAERAAATVTDHVKGVPGLSISTGGIVQANIVSRGFNNAFSGSMLMLQDYRFAGVPSLRVNVPFLFTGSNEDIDHIEVLQGPAAALYGPNSSGGVLHVITKSPFESKGTTLTVSGGEHSFGRLSGRHAGATSNGKIGYKLSGEMFTASDFEYIDPNEPTTYSGTDARIPASRRGQNVAHDFSLKKQTGEARVDFRPDVNTEFITTAGYSKMGSGREITTTFGAVQAKDWSYSNFQERFRHKDFFAQVFYDKSNSGNENAADDAGSYYLRSGIPVVDRSTVLVGQVQQRFEFRNTRLVAGGEYNATRPTTEGTINGRNEADDDINEYGAYLQSTTPLTSKLDFLASVRGDVNSRIEGTQFSPRAAIVWKITPKHNLRYTFNRSFNSPQSFSFSLDQFYATGAPGMDVQVMGNPSKKGWTFARGGTCANGAGSGLCMRSPYIPGVLAPASAAAAFPGLMLALPTLAANAPASQIPGGEVGRAQALALLPSLAPILNSLRPTDANIGTKLVELATNRGLTKVDDIGPLTAAFTNTWEVGYKGIIGKRLSLSADYWWQRRPADPASGVINPAIFADTAQLHTYVNAALTQGLTAAGLPPAQAAGTAAAASGLLTSFLAALPLGAAAFDSPLYDKPYLVLSYAPATGYVNVAGLDLAADVSLTDEWTLATTYSYLNKNVFPDAPGATAANPVAANAARNRATATFRYSNEARHFTAEVRGRYTDAFPVNSGLLNSYNIRTPVPYPAVPVNALLDLNGSWMLPMLKGARLNVTGTNILNNEVQTFVGVPKIGRLIVTQLQYTF